jgi:chemotaxis receptor (MCP) glutamine deamidase CheD
MRQGINLVFKYMTLILLISCVTICISDKLSLFSLNSLDHACTPSQAIKQCTCIIERCIAGGAYSSAQHAMYIGAHKMGAAQTRRPHAGRLHEAAFVKV